LTDNTARSVMGERQNQITVLNHKSLANRFKSFCHHQITNHFAVNLKSNHKSQL